MAKFAADSEQRGSDCGDRVRGSGFELWTFLIRMSEPCARKPYENSGTSIAERSAAGIRSLASRRRSSASSAIASRPMAIADARSAHDGQFGPSFGEPHCCDEADLEAVLLLAREPLSLRKLAQSANLSDGTEARTLLTELRRCYDARGGAFSVEQLAGGYQLMTRPKFASWLRPLVPAEQEIRLSPPALETLAVVAYRQPVLRAEVEAIRGRGLRRITSPVDGSRPLAYCGTFRRIRSSVVVRDDEAIPPCIWIE